jgi:hypothetical protein
MATGYDRRVRDAAMRHGDSVSWTRDTRLRYLPTKHCHAVPTREYQSDSSSKCPEPSYSFYLRTGPPWKRISKNDLTKVGPYQQRSGKLKSLIISIASKSQGILD